MTDTVPDPNRGAQVALLSDPPQAKEDYRSFGVDPNPNHFEQTCEFLAQLTLAVYGCGGEAWRLQHFLTYVTTSLGYQGVFHLMPSAMMLAVQPSPNEPQRVQLLDYPDVSMDFSKLVDAEEVALDLIAKKISLEEATEQLVAIERRPEPRGKLRYIASFPAVAVGVASMSRGCWWDVLLGALLSVLVAILTLKISGIRIPFVAALVTSLIATATKLVIPELDIYIVSLSAIMLLLPGLPIMSGTAQLASDRDIASGIVSLVYAVIYCVYLIVGAWFGYRLVAKLAHQVPSTAATPVDSFWIWIFFPLEIFGFCDYTLMAIKRDLPWAALNCLIGYFGGEVGTMIKSEKTGAFLAGFLVFLFGNIWCGKSKRSASIVLVPALFYLVPTSPFHVFAEMTQGETNAATRDFWQMFLAALLMEAGFVAGNAVVPQKMTFIL